MAKGKIIFQLAWICMGIVLLCGSSLVTGARAFSLSSLTLRQVRTSAGYLIPPARGGALFAATDEDEPEKRNSATGWNHNKPKESSKFWQSANGDDSAAEQQLRQTESDSENNEAQKTTRTGWLHNTKSNKKVEEPKEGGISKAQLRLQQAMKQQERNHRILSPPTFHACGSERQIVVTEHRLSIPVYRPDTNPRIDLAFTIVEEVKDEATQKWFTSLGSMSPQQRATAYIKKAALKNADEMMIYLQGGPGFGAPAPVVGLAFSQDSSWGAEVLNKYKRIVLMDQRGTGKSTPITKQSLEKRFPDLFLQDDKGDTDLESLASSLKEATNYMAQFRADSIVRDAEDVREALMLPGEPGSVS
jgi:hypothetical protein